MLNLHYVHWQVMIVYLVMESVNLMHLNVINHVVKHYVKNKDGIMIMEDIVKKKLMQ